MHYSPVSGIVHQSRRGFDPFVLAQETLLDDVTEDRRTAVVTRFAPGNGDAVFGSLHTTRRARSAWRIERMSRFDRIDRGRRVRRAILILGHHSELVYLTYRQVSDSHERCRDVAAHLQVIFSSYKL